jgi:hypothetical protein
MTAGRTLSASQTSMVPSADGVIPSSPVPPTNHHRSHDDDPLPPPGRIR